MKNHRDHSSKAPPQRPWQRLIQSKDDISRLGRESLDHTRLGVCPNNNITGDGLTDYSSRFEDFTIWSAD